MLPKLILYKINFEYYDFMLNVMPLETKKKVAIEYAQKEPRSNLDIPLQKKMLTEKKMGLQEMRDRRVIGHVEDKPHNDRHKSPIRNGLNFPIQRQRSAE